MTILGEEIIHLLMAANNSTPCRKSPWDIGKILVESLQRAEMCNADPRLQS